MTFIDIPNFLPASSTTGLAAASVSNPRAEAAVFSSAPGMALRQNTVDEFSSLSLMASDSVLGPSLATGMSRDPANVGGKHEAVTPLSNGSDLETLIAETGTSPGACGTERGIVGATNSVSDRGNMGRRLIPALGTSVASLGEAIGNAGKQPSMATRLTPPRPSDPNFTSDPLDIPDFLRRARPAHGAIEPELTDAVIPIARANNVATEDASC